MQAVIIKTTVLKEQKIFSCRASDVVCNYNRTPFRRVEKNSRLCNRRRKIIMVVCRANYRMCDPGTDVDCRQECRIVTAYDKILDGWKMMWVNYTQMKIITLIAKIMYSFARQGKNWKKL